MDDHTERRLRDADPLAGRAHDDSRDEEWLSETARSAATQPPRTTPRRGLVLMAAAAAVVLAATAGGLLLRGGDEPTKTPAAAETEAPTVTDLELPPSGVMGSCVMFSVEQLGKAPVAFGGEVVEMSDDEVLVEVEQWFRGGDTDQVRMTVPDTSMTSLGYSVEFEVGSRYLVSAYDGVVDACGFSGPWTTEMGEAYAEAFGS